MNSGGKKSCSNSMKWGENLEPIPTDLIIDIFSRLPAKSVARFRTLSKLWASMLSSQEFTDLFRTRSSTRPRLLFAVERYKYNTWLFFSTTQQQNSSSSSSHVDFHTKFAGDISRYICSYASGLFYFPHVSISDEEKPLICNPITGMYVSLPELRQNYRKPRGFLGYDRTKKQFKVLSEIDDQHEVLTLGNGELRWRRSNNNIISYCPSMNEGICIDGVLYYLAGKSHGSSCVIVCFDLSSEEFKLIDADCFNDQLASSYPLAIALSNNPLALDGVPVTRLILINYKGKLGGINWKYGEASGGRRTIELCMWVLEDMEKQEWLKYVYILPENKVLDSCEFSVSGVTGSGDIVLCMKYTCNPFFVFYFNPEKNTLQSVEIHGFGANLEAVETRGQVYAFVNHVEDISVNDVKLLKSSISQIICLCSCCKTEVKAA